MTTPTDAFNVPHSARMYDYYLGGKNNYQVDREAAEKVLDWWPGVRDAAQANRAFMQRAIRHLIEEEGLRQFLDIGTGIPTEPNLHQVAQEAAPECRIVYVDKDPLVLAHAESLMRSTPQGRTTYLHADLITDLDNILESPQLAETIDLSKPVALSLLALLHFVTDEQGAHKLVRRLLDALPAGSALLLSHVTPDFNEPAMRQVEEIYRRGGIQGQTRTREEVARFFDGLDLVEPGITVPHRWRALASASTELDTKISAWAAVGVKRA
ncbi:SAM-dependent methyltransferase [Streptomyces sp. 8K308]|uniref:SAM-dependent methyltransferase n=1 Tax=Streptomyces sp. 8K308 TaxID=2530388 RepID=UPI00105302C9|nr:SAM-dependent methyltransferase [Streptomyces sp. 8K308]TDC22469.1 SAM-dependent methyltransferase [Streptomyces sp. 8K308]